MSSELTIIPEENLNSALELARSTVYKSYLEELGRYELAEPDRMLLDEEPQRSIRMFRLTQLTCKKGEDIFQKLSTVYHAAMSLGCSLVVMADSAGTDDASNIYVGLRNPNGPETEMKHLRTSFSALREGLLSNFPGVRVTELSASKALKPELDAVFGENSRYISSVSCVAAQRDKSKTENKSFIQGLEKLVDVMRGRPYTAVLIAEPVRTAQLAQIRAGYESLYSTLSVFRKSSVSFNETQSETVMESLSHSVSESVTNGTSLTQSHTSFHSGGTGTGTSTGVGIHIPILNFSPHLSSSISSFQSSGTGSGQAAGTSAAKTAGTADTTSQGRQTGTSSGRTVQLEAVNKTAEEMLRRIEDQLKRIQECENYGAYSCGAYFLSGKQDNSLLAANTYRALMLGDGSSVESGAVNLWTDEAEVETMKEYLRRFAQPVFLAPAGGPELRYTPGTLVSGQELPLHLGLPTRSVPGLAVVDHAEFGRNVLVEGPAVTLGALYHMGQIERSSDVRLGRGQLAAHTFVTGTTGAGKTNTVCALLDALCLHPEDPAQPANFLVVEPAKGEYKSMLGGYEGVAVYGTNPKKTELLQLNPFYFPEDIHVLEHIDRLVEVFNACWPMYAAMPAVLKDAIEASYVACGWSLKRSVCAANSFPTFAMLLGSLRRVLEGSGFSDETKGDYTGALVTRVKSLTNGINGQIFCGDGLDGEALFERNVIVDLSRVGSMETKALIMGILMIQLQEYRLSSAEKPNAALRHITVLEEAHNLLRRTSAEQAQDSANLQGKSVEMLAGAIAEMRTYGEGFIIADQAPGLLDMAVIRNTNTKIIMRLPDEGDRMLVGKAAGLNDDQITELSKLEVGVAAVYQSDWLEPVLCQVNKFRDCREFHFSASERPDPAMDALVRTLLHGTGDARELSEENAARLRRWIERLDMDEEYTNILFRALKDGTPAAEEDRGELFYCLAHCRDAVERTGRLSSTAEMNALLEQHIADELNISAAMAAEIRETVARYAAPLTPADTAWHRRLLVCGGVK